jgi:hypothetical protein
MRALLLLKVISIINSRAKEKENVKELKQLDRTSIVNSEKKIVRNKPSTGICFGSLYH